MNRGTSRKWMTCLRETSAAIDCSQLGYNYDTVHYRCPVGILCDFIYQTPTLGWDGVSVLYDDEQFYPSDDLLKRVKSKGGLRNMCDMHFTDFIAAAAYVDINYADL